MCLGTDVSVHNHVWAQIKCVCAQIKCVWAQSCLGTIVSGHNRVWAQSCLGTIVSGHNRVRAQSCLGTIVSKHNRVWAQSCLGTVVWAQSCGPNHVWAQSWWNHFEVPFYFTLLRFLACDKLFDIVAHYLFCLKVKKIYDFMFMMR